MNPRKAKELLPPIASEMEVPLKLAEDLTDFFWDDLHRELNLLEQLHVMVPFLGTFHMRSEKVITETIEKLDRYNAPSRVSPPKTLQRYARFAETEKRIAKLKRLVELQRMQDEEKSRIKQLRKDARKIKEDLEQQGSDS